MPLKITLKPHEKMIIGGAVITGGKTATNFVIENKVPVLREKDILSEDDAYTPARRIYLVIQLMYIDGKNLTKLHGTYWNLARDLLKAAPSMLGLIDQISEHILDNRYYQALKLAKKLITYEEEVLDHVYESCGSV